MRALILAAGRGSRLMPLTENCPKCMVKVNNQPLLSWQISALSSAGIREIMVVCGYREDQITGSFNKKINTRWAESNMVTSLLCGFEWLKEGPCIVSYSDIIYPKGAVERLIEAEPSAPLAILYDKDWYNLWTQRFQDPLCDAESFRINHANNVTDIGRSNVALSDIEGQYMGLLRFSPEAVSWISNLMEELSLDPDTLDMTTLLSLMLKKGKEIKGISWKGDWCEIDSLDDLTVAERIFVSGGK